MDDGAPLIGRAREQESLRDFLAQLGRGSRACLLEGEPGIGKTALWRWCQAEARAHSRAVLAHAASRAETGLAYAGVDALLAGVPEDVIEGLPRPQRRALAVALLQEDPGERAPDQRLIGAAVLGTLRAMSEDGPVLVAVDDVQWLDEASAVVLAYAARRLSAEPVGLLLAQRVSPSERLPQALAEGLPDDRLMRLEVPALSQEGVRWLLSERMEPGLAQRTVRRVWKTSAGNPLFALELGRALRAAGSDPAPGQPLPVPDTLSGLVEAHLRALPTDTHELLLFAAAAVAPTSGLLAAAAEASHGATVAALEAGVEAGVLAADAEQVRFAHPLFADVLLAGAPPAQRRRLHERLAAVVADIEQRARHAALAAVGPDTAVAALLDEAAESSAARGAPQLAADLAELAARLTPSDEAAEILRRRVRTAEFVYRSGDVAGARDILQAELERAPAGAARADVLIALGGMHWHDFPLAIDLLETGLREAGDDPVRACVARLKLSDVRSLAGENLEVALATLRPALAAAERSGDDQLLMRVLSGLALLEGFAGRSTPGLLERALELEEAGVRAPRAEQPTLELGRRLKLQDEYDAARAALARALERAAGDEPARLSVLVNLATLECRAGDFGAAARYAAQALELAEVFGIEEQGGAALYCSALADAHLGRVEAARAAAERGTEVSAAAGDAIFDIHNRFVLGFLELSLGDATAADARLRPLVPRHLATGSDEPSHLPLWPDAIEAAVGTGELAVARENLERFERLARGCPSPWALATAARCEGILAAAEGDHERALAAFDSALAEHERTSPFERGRTLLALGQAQRRLKRKRPAREALEQALTIFEQSRTPLWAQRARTELRRISGRGPATAELTPTEQRVAELVAEGHSNKKVAAALFVSVHTVEANLTRIYRKLGVQSRTELAHRLARQSEAAGSGAPKM